MIRNEHKKKKKEKQMIRIKPATSSRPRLACYGSRIRLRWCVDTEESGRGGRDGTQT